MISEAWAWRRRLAITLIVFSCGLIVWAAQWMRVETAMTVIASSFALIGTILTVYVFGAVWDDREKRKADNELIMQSGSMSTTPPPVPSAESGAVS